MVSVSLLLFRRKYCNNILRTTIMNRCYMLKTLNGGSYTCCGDQLLSFRLVVTGTRIFINQGISFTDHLMEIPVFNSRIGQFTQLLGLMDYCTFKSVNLLGKINLYICPPLGLPKIMQRQYEDYCHKVGLLNEKWQP